MEAKSVAILNSWLFGINSIMTRFFFVSFNKFPHIYYVLAFLSIGQKRLLQGDEDNASLAKSSFNRSIKQVKRSSPLKTSSPSKQRFLEDDDFTNPESALRWVNAVRV